MIYNAKTITAIPHKIHQTFSLKFKKDITIFQMKERSAFSVLKIFSAVIASIITVIRRTTKPLPIVTVHGFVQKLFSFFMNAPSRCPSAEAASGHFSFSFLAQRPIGAIRFLYQRSTVLFQSRSVLQSTEQGSA